MFGLETVYYIFILLIIIQSIAGVGVLVIGTPTLLLMNYDMIEIKGENQFKSFNYEILHLYYIYFYYSFLILILDFYLV